MTEYFATSRARRRVTSHRKATLRFCNPDLLDRSPAPSRRFRVSTHDLAMILIPLAASASSGSAVELGIWNAADLLGSGDPPAGAVYAGDGCWLSLRVA